jgi:hypothetical protein
MFLERACAHRDEKAVAAFQSPIGRLWPDHDDVEVGLGACVAAGVAADEDHGRRAAFDEFLRY